jgi:hypothetical protein
MTNGMARENGEFGSSKARMKAQTRRPGWAFTTVWFLVTAVGVVLCGFLFHFPGAFPPNNREAFNLNPVGALTAGLGTGVLVGGLQAWLLRRVGLRAGRWLLGSTVALFLVHALGDMLPDSLALPLMVLLGGWLLGLGQWWAASWPVRVGLAWTAINGIIWAVTLWVGYEAGHAMDDWRAEHLIVAAAVGAGIGAATAAMWLWPPVLETVRKPPRQTRPRDAAAGTGAGSASGSP